MNEPIFFETSFEKTLNEMNIPLISIIVPVYNTSPWLAKCLDCICAQDYRKLEILCIDDGSTDNSVEVLGECTSRLRYNLLLQNHELPHKSGTNIYACFPKRENEQ